MIGYEMLENQVLIGVLQSILPVKKRKRGIREAFEKHKEEIIYQRYQGKEPVKLKTAFLIIKEKYAVPGSYETFILFMRE